MMTVSYRKGQDYILEGLGDRQMGLTPKDYRLPRE